MTVTFDGPLVPSWIAGMKFCHIDDGSELRSLCGDDETAEVTCGYYHGEAICSTCGLPTCPRCAVLEAEDESDDL